MTGCFRCCQTVLPPPEAPFLERPSGVSKIDLESRNSAFIDTSPSARSDRGGAKRGKSVDVCDTPRDESPEAMERAIKDWLNIIYQLCPHILYDHLKQKETKRLAAYTRTMSSLSTTSRARCLSLAFSPSRDQLHRDNRGDTGGSSWVELNPSNQKLQDLIDAAPRRANRLIPSPNANMFTVSNAPSNASEEKYWARYVEAFTSPRSLNNVNSNLSMTSLNTSLSNFTTTIDATNLETLRKVQQDSWFPYSVTRHFARVPTLAKAITSQPEPSERPLTFVASGVLKAAKLSNRIKEDIRTFAISDGQNAKKMARNSVIVMTNGTPNTTRLGINPYKFSTRMLFSVIQGAERLAGVHLLENAADVGPGNTAHLLLSESYARTNNPPIYGACTSLVMCMANNHIGVANIGDCGVMVLRRQPPEGFRNIVFRTQRQEDINTFQLARFPPTWQQVGGQPTLADVFEWPVMSGDLILVACSCIFNCLWEADIVSIVSLIMSPQELKWKSSSSHKIAASRVARALVSAAYAAGCDPTHKTPANRKGSNKKKNKPMNDITVVAAWVTEMN